MQYHSAMPEPPSPRQRIDPMAVSAYVVTAAITVLGLNVFLGGGGPHGWVGVLLLAAFDLLVLLPDDALGGIKKRAPHLYVAAAATLVIAVTMVPPENPWFVVLFFVISPDVMLRFPRQTGYAWIGAFSALTVIAYWVAGSGSLEALLIAPLYIAGYFFFGAFATQTALATAAQAESQRLLAELQEAHARLQAYAAQAEALAAAEERNRLAREMHDTLGHRLTVAAVQAQAVERLVRADPDRAAQLAGVVREEVREALADLRRTVAALRAPLEADLPLDQALRHLAGEFEAATGVHLSLSLPDPLPAIPAKHRLALYRSAQEALTNVQRHAAAERAWLALAADGVQVSLLVSDDGAGFAPGVEQAGFGLLGMRERATQLGGELHVDARPGGGTRVQLALPIAPEPPADDAAGSRAP